MFVYVVVLGGSQRQRKLSRSSSICLQSITFIHLFIHLFALGGMWEALFLAPPLLGCFPLDDNSSPLLQVESYNHREELVRQELSLP